MLEGDQPQPGRNGTPTSAALGDGGAASWYDVAVAVGELAVELGLLKQAAKVNPISTADYPTPATRPVYSLLDCQCSRAALNLEAQPWRTALKDVLKAIPNNS